MQLDVLPAEVELNLLLDERLRRLNTRKLLTYFPETGPLRRELYKKHMEFFRLGFDHSFRAFLAGNRCLSPWTFIERPDSQSIQIVELLTSEDRRVLSWDGESECVAHISDGFVKGIEPAFRVVLDNGEFFDCSRKHRVLTSEGWISFGRLMSLSSGLHLTYRVEDFEASCVEGGYLYDRQPLSVKDTYQEQPQEVGDAQRQRLIFSLEDVTEHTLQCIRACLNDDRLTNPGDLDRLSDLFSQFSGASVPQNALRTTEKHRALSKFVTEYGQRLKDGTDFHDQALESFLSRLEMVDCDAATKLQLALSSGQRMPQYLSFGCPDCSFPELTVHESHISIFYSFEHPHLVGDRYIVAVVPIGLQPIIDGSVKGLKNYRAAGVYHHNTGKTESGGGYELVLHLTGRYPDWWEGALFDAPIRAWAAGDTSKTVRDIIQYKLLGAYGKFGTGLIPADDIVKFTTKTGVAEAIDTITVKHYDPDGIYDGESYLVLKSYDQGRESFQGTEQDVIWLDEESDEAIRGECVMRLMTTNGLLIETMTPLKGITPLIQTYLPNGAATSEVEVSEDKAIVMAGWDDVPHLGEAEKAKMYAETPPYLRDARSKGIPSLGSGAIYPVPETEITVEDFPIPDYWPRLYALDVGWNRTAALWGVWNRDSDIIYLVSEHYRGQAEPSVHANAIRARGSWINGVIDPAARGRSQRDGKKLIVDYRELGLRLTEAENAVESGIYDVWQRLSSGRLKVFKSMQNWLSEYRMYRRDEKGQIVKVNDHLMDDMRYLIAAPEHLWTVRKPEKTLVEPYRQQVPGVGL